MLCNVLLYIWNNIFVNSINYNYAIEYEEPPIIYECVIENIDFEYIFYN